MKVGQVSHDFDWDFHTMPCLAGLDDDDYFFLVLYGQSVRVQGISQVVN